ncbi:hypothetical protein MASR2M17_23510 [Aminivibrio sp.]
MGCRTPSACRPNAAIKNNTHPAKWTYENIAYMRSQLKRLGYSYDWEREIATCREVLRFGAGVLPQVPRKGPGLPQEGPGQLVPELPHGPGQRAGRGRTVLALRLEVQQKELSQWFLRITDYADELLSALDTLTEGWPERV